MATVLFGHIREFDSSKKEWLQYEERLAHFFVANGITNTDKKRAVFLSIIGASPYKLLHNLISSSKPGDKSYAKLMAALYEEHLGHFFVANGITNADKKRAVFLSIIGASTYKLLHNLISSSKPGDKSYAKLMAALQKHFHPTPLVIVERFRFHSRVRKPGESVATFVSELRCLSQFCGFGDTLEDMLKDHLVCGISDNSLQKRLLAEPDLTYLLAVDLAQRNETASQQVKDLKAGQPQKPINRLEDNFRSKELTCFHCGRRGHFVTRCQVRADIVCRSCGNKGHLQRACRSQGKGRRRQTKSKL